MNIMKERDIMKENIRDSRSKEKIEWTKNIRKLVGKCRKEPAKRGNKRRQVLLLL